MSRRSPPSLVTPEVVLRAYSVGLFPMAEDKDSNALFWVEPKARGLFDIDGLTISTSLAKAVRSDRFEVWANRDFSAVMEGCAARSATWINAEIRRLYGELHAMGRAHSVEAYLSGELVGGLYGVSLAGAFFGESMFHQTRDASKVALVHCVARLKLGRFRLLDTQFLTPHLASLGAYEVPREEYLARLSAALAVDADASTFNLPPMSGAEALALARPTAR